MRWTILLVAGLAAACTHQKVANVKTNVTLDDFKGVWVVHRTLRPSNPAEQLHVNECEPIDGSSDNMVRKFGSQCLGVFVIRQFNSKWWIRISPRVLKAPANWGTNGRLELQADAGRKILFTEFTPHHSTKHLLCIKWNPAASRPRVLFDTNDLAMPDAEECEAMVLSHRGAIH